MLVRVQQAHCLRRQATDAERLLWHHLRGRQLGGWRFRRQHGIGQCIVDFCCPEAKLVLEVDGGQHASAQTEDARRSLELHHWGYRVLRFWNEQGLQQTEMVLEEIQRGLVGK